MPTPKKAKKPAAEHPAIAALSTALITRSIYAQRLGYTFDGKRNMRSALGYQETLQPLDYRYRYLRNAVAAAVVEAMPKASWRAGAEVIDDDDPEATTDFEDAFQEIEDTHRFWNVMQRADILAGLGRHAAVLIGAPGDMETELPKMKGPEDVLYLAPYGEEEMRIHEWEVDPANERYGLPKAYRYQRRTAFETAQARAVLNDPRSPGVTDASRIVHWTRVIHVTDGLLDDRVYGTPRLERIWNLLDDLEKVTGGGSEAFWQRAHQGLQLDVDKEMPITPEDVADLKEEVQNYIHGMSRTMRTRGVTVNPLGSDVANFNDPSEAILTQICAGSRIPRRILEGSEQGELASSQDRTNWNERVRDRRAEMCEPLVRDFVDRLIEHGGLPKPKEDEYEVIWPREEDLTLTERVTLVNTLATANATHIAAAGEPLVLGREMRDEFLDLEPIDEVLEDGETGIAPPPTLMDRETGEMIPQEPGAPPIEIMPPRKPSPEETEQAKAKFAPKAAVAYGGWETKRRRKKRKGRRFARIDVAKLADALRNGDEETAQRELERVLAS